MMEDCIEVILQDHTAGGIIIIAVRMIGLAFAGVYGLWAMFCTPGRRAPFRPKQTQNVIKLVDGRKLRLADLGTGDGRLMGVLEEKLLKELPEDARLIVCRFLAGPTAALQDLD